jgi:hypothetical protein
MESTRQKQIRLAALWLLIAASLLLSVVSLSRSRPQYDAKLQDLEDRMKQLEADYSRLLNDLQKVITTVGTHKLYGGKLTLNVFEDGGGLNYRVTRVKQKGPIRAEGASPKEPFIHSGADWFAFPESADVVWIFDGQNVLNRVEFEEGTTKTMDSVVVPDIVTRAPKAVQDRLPASFLEKLKGN